MGFSRTAWSHHEQPMCSLTPATESAIRGPGCLVIETPSIRRAPGRVIYLTFDDGPSPTYTPQVLNLLKRFNAKATFFLVGQNVNSSRRSFRRTVNEGHTLGNHTWSTRTSRESARRTSSPP